MPALIRVVTLVFALSLLPGALVSVGHTAAPKYAVELGALVNQYRVRKNLPELAINPTLTALAHEHSATMAREGRMSHDAMPSRVRRSGFGMCVENVGWNYPTVREQFDGWRTSPGHDRNLLDRRVAHMGVGVVDGYVTFIACGT
jgi:uncharacterized protein YkwD